MKQIIPNRDLQNEIQKNKVLNSRDFYKGKSFRFVHEWHAGITYFNDEFVTDFVVYNNVMLACKKSHTSFSENAPVIIYDSNNEVQPIGVKSDYWEFVLSGISTQDGKFKVGFSDTVENLPNANEHIGEIYVVGPINDSYVEYVAIHSPSYDNQYIWEKVSSDVTVDAYTKQESDEKYQLKGNYLTSIPEEYVTDDELEKVLEEKFANINVNKFDGGEFSFV